MRNWLIGLAGGIFILGVLMLRKEAEAAPKTGCTVPSKAYPLSSVLRWYPLASKYADMYNVDPALVLAIIHVESRGNPRAYRWERHLNDASRGLMQVLYRTAKELGFKGNKTDLYDPETNISLGTKYLSQQIAKYGLEAGIAAYNAGRPKFDSRGCFINQSYVNKVMGAYEAYKNEIEGGSYVW